MAKKKTEETAPEEVSVLKAEEIMGGEFGTQPPEEKAAEIKAQEEAVTPDYPAPKQPFINTSRTLGARVMSQSDLQAQLDAAKRRMDKEPIVQVSIPASLAKAIPGGHVPLGINGVFLVIPADGKKYDVPKPYQLQLETYLNTLEV